MIEVKTNPTLMSPFHLAFPVDDLTRARAFYGELLGCPEGRSSDAVSYTHLTLPTKA